MNQPGLMLTVLSLTSLAYAASAGPNLVSNPGFEQAGGPSAAERWTPLVKGAPAQFHIDKQVFHGGRCSLRIDAPEITRAYICNEAIPVSPGEKLRVSAWVRTRDVPAGQGTTIVIGEYLNARGGPAGEVVKVGVAKAGSEWQQISGQLQVPERSVGLRLRLGFSYSRGTCWWDDVKVEPAGDSVAARVDVLDERLYPAAGSVPVTLFNRAGQKGPIGVRVSVGEQRSVSTVELTGKPVQTLDAPLKVKARGKQKLRIEVLDAADRDRIRFASPEMSVTVPQPLTFSPLVPTHGVVEDGPTVLEGEVEIALAAGSPQRNRMSVSVVDSSGRVKASREFEDVTAAGIRRFEIRLPAMEEGTCTVRLAVARPDAPPLTAEQPWPVIRRRLARTTLNAAGFPECDGKTIFPLGMFNNSGRVDECAAAGLNIVHTYNAARVQPGRRPDDQRLKDLLDRTSKAGMKCLLLVPMEYAFVGDWDSFTWRIRMFRNHPALLAWDEEEGIARGDMDLAALARMREILNREDPHHPFMVGDSHVVINRVTDRSRMFPAELMDLGMWWWYPFPLRTGSGDALQGESAQGRAELEPPAFFDQKKTDKPVWVGVQTYKKPGPNGRYPTPVEYRAQAYAAVIHGAQGIMWYGGSVTGGLFLDPEKGRWDELKKVIGELRDLSPVLLSPSQETPSLEPADAPVSVAVKPVAGGRLLLAVNRSLEDQTVRIKVPGALSAQAIVRGEHRTVAVDAGVIQDRFAPLAVHLYELPAER